MVPGWSPCNRRVIHQPAMIRHHFEIIPVIDVRQGVAVHAVGGDRQNYRTLETPLACAADPVAVARGYMALHPFRTIYIADLDGIQGRGRDRTLVGRLEREIPGVEFWIDDGAATLEEVAERLTGRRSSVVVGSETLTDRRLFAELAGGELRRLVLSLDHRGEARLGPDWLFADPAQWPERVIAMQLGLVGRRAGPDLGLLEALLADKGGDRRVYAAGGIRDAGDLDAVRRAGAAGALVATALHQGNIKAGDL